MKIKRQRRAAINRARKEILKLENKVTEFACEFINRSAAAYRVYERGKHLLDVPADGKSRLEMFSASVSWARWAKVIIGKDGTVETLVENTHWAAPWRKEDGFWLTELYNENGSSGGQNIRLCEPNPVLRTGSPYLLIPLGVPQLIPIRYDDPIVKWVKMHWVIREKKLPLGDTGYYNKRVEVVCDKTLRPQSELVEIFQYRAALNAEAFEKEQKKMLPELELTEEALDEDGGKAL